MIYRIASESITIIQRQPAGLWRSERRETNSKRSVTVPVERIHHRCLFAFLFLELIRFNQRYIAHLHSRITARETDNLIIPRALLNSIWHYVRSEINDSSRYYRIAHFRWDFRASSGSPPRLGITFTKMRFLFSSRGKTLILVGKKAPGFITPHTRQKIYRSFYWKL